MAASRKDITYRPLTTVFTSPAHCATDTLGWGGTAGSTTIYQNYLAYSIDYGCFPSYMYDGYATYSPGICPLGYSTVHTSVIDNSITSAQCCPTGYGGEGERSIRNLGGCTKSYTTTTTAWIWVSGGAPTIGRVGPGTAEKHQIVVFYQSSDLSLFPSDYTPGTIPAQTGTAGPSDSGSTPVETGGGGNPIETLGGQTLGGGTGGLSTGAKAGIGAGVAIGVLAVLGILFLFFQRRRRSARTKDLPEKLELDASLAEKRQGPVVAELHAHDPAAFPAGRHELHGTQIQKELDVPEELPAHLPPEMPGPDTVSPADLSPVELETAAPVPSATEKPILASHRTQPGHSSPSGHFPLSPSELSSTSAAASASELSAQASGVQGMPTTIEELELQYLESEARRIQQRKEEILRERGGKTGEGS